MALASGVLGTCSHALEIHEPSCIGRSARPFFIGEIHGPLGAMGRVVAPEPSLSEWWGPKP
jgi:hypothetical protein